MAVYTRFGSSARRMYHFKILVLTIAFRCIGINASGPTCDTYSYLYAYKNCLVDDINTHFPGSKLSKCKGYDYNCAASRADCEATAEAMNTNKLFLAAGGKAYITCMSDNCLSCGCCSTQSKDSAYAKTLKKAFDAVLSAPTPAEDDDGYDDDDDDDDVTPSPPPATATTTRPPPPPPPTTTTLPPPPPPPRFQCDWGDLMAKPNNMKTCVAISKALNVLDGISLGIGVPHREGDDYKSSDGIDCTTNGGYYPIATAETREAINALQGVGPDVSVESGDAMQNQKNCGKVVDALNLILARLESRCNQKGSIAQNGTCICDADAVGTECYSDEITCKGVGTANADGSCDCFAGTYFKEGVGCMDTTTSTATLTTTTTTATTTTTSETSTTTSITGTTSTGTGTTVTTVTTTSTSTVTTTTTTTTTSTTFTTITTTTTTATTTTSTRLEWDDTCNPENDICDKKFELVCFTRPDGESKCVYEVSSTFSNTHSSTTKTTATPPATTTTTTPATTTPATTTPATTTPATTTTTTYVTTNAQKTTESSTPDASRIPSTTTAGAHSANNTVPPPPEGATENDKELPLGIMIGGAAGVILVLGVIFVVRSRRKRMRRENVGIQMQNALWNPNDTNNDDDELLLVGTLDSDVDAGLATSSTNMAALAETRFVAPDLIVGEITLAAAGLPAYMGVDESIFFVQDRMGAILAEFEKHGNDEDKQNARTLLDGSYVNPPDPKKPDQVPVPSKTLEELMNAPEVAAAGLDKHHVYALRLYTTSSYKCINNPMRMQPPTRPHPFAVTTYFISDAIKKLRTVAGEQADANSTKTFWRGLKDMTLSMAFLKQGGTECACMSTSSSMDVAIEFAESDCPLIFKFQSSSFMSQGADISFLSVYPEEKEVLYPPLTYLRPIRANLENIGGQDVLVAHVEPIFPS